MLVSLLYFSFISIGNAQITYLEIEVSTTSLTADQNNMVTITVYNNFEPIYELCVSISFPTSSQDSASPTIIGESSCKFDKLAEGDSREFPVIIFVPEEGEGNAYTLNIDLTYKRLGYISSITEYHTVGFYVHEEEATIDLIFYEVDVEPDPAHPGASISFTANLLNKGNSPAMYTNISLVENDVLLLPLESYSYLGQVDPNSPASFDLEASIKTKTKEGRYVAEILVNYEDEDNVPYTVSSQIPFTVVELEEEVSQGPLDNLLGPIGNLLFPSSLGSSQSGLFQGLIPILIIVVIIMGVVVLVRRRRSKKNEFEEAFEEEEGEQGV